MSNNLVPNVSIRETVSSLAVPSANQVVIGMIGTSEKGTANTIYNISSVTEADTIFGSKYSYGATLVPMIRKAFEEGASFIKAVSIGTPTLAVATALLQGALTADSAAGTSAITVASATIYTAGDKVYIGPDATYAKEEYKTVATAVGTTVTFTTPLEYTHYIGENAKIVTAKVDGDYTASITTLEADIDKSIAICESNSVAVSAAMKTMVINSTNNYSTPCIYVQSALSTDDESSIVAKATTHNSDRVVIGYPLLKDYSDRILSPGENAAALAGLIVNKGLPQLNLNFSEFRSLKGVSKAITNNDTLISGGISAIELKYGSLHMVKIVTTKTTSNSIPDSTWREASIRLNVDIIEKTIAVALQRLYMNQGNTPTVRSSIKDKVISILNFFAGLEILVADENTNTPAFREPLVTTDVLDSSKVNIDIGISPGKPLNFIQLNFKLSI